MQHKLGRFGFLLIGIAIVNFTVFVLVAICIGGDAINGKIVDGHYYVSNHGRLTEVQRWVWNYSKAHAICVIVTSLVGIILGGGLVSISRLNWWMTRN